MKKIIDRFGMIAIIGIMLLVSYWLGTQQVETITEIKTIEKVKTIVPSNYINMKDVTDFVVTDYGLQLYFKDGTGYYWER